MLSLDLAVLAAVALILAGLTLFDRRLVQASALFVGFSISMSLVWWRVGFPWLALLEVVLGAVLTGVFLLHALGVGRVANPSCGGPARRCDPARPTRQHVMLRLLPVLVTLGMLLLALEAPQTGRADPPGLPLVGLALLGLGLWAFALHRHLLRRLLAFNVIGTGVFLLLIALSRESETWLAQGLVSAGLVVALLGTALGSRLYCRLSDLEAEQHVSPGSDGDAA